ADAGGAPALAAPGPRPRQPDHRVRNLVLMLISHGGGTMSRAAAEGQLIELSRFSLSAMVQLGQELRSTHHAVGSMEEVADRVVRIFRERFIDELGQPANSLVRFYKTIFYGDLEDDLRVVAARTLLGTAPGPKMRCLVLLASAGTRPEWN